MGIPAQIAHMILEEHKHKPIKGDLLLCGRQAMHMKVDQAKDFVKQRGVNVREGVEPRVDVHTREAKGNGWISDDSFFSLFTDARFNAVDVTDYEQANIIHNMCTPIEAKLHKRFDFIYNGSCMDNLANPGAFLVNTLRMLRPGGVVIHLEHGSLWPGAYLMYSPDWFFDFYAVNNYADCKVYLATFEGAHIGAHTTSHWNIFQWDPLRLDQVYGSNTTTHTASYLNSIMVTKAHVLIIALAEKAENSTDDIFPIQAGYRPNVDVQGAYVASALRFRQSLRPVLNAGAYRAIEPNNFPLFCGSL